MSEGIDKLIINSAFEEPKLHWKYNFETKTFEKKEGRRPAGYFIAGQGSNAYNDIGQFVELPMVNIIRERVKAWREAGYTNVSGVTKQLLEHWNNQEMRQYPFFFCQLDAIETLIWFIEAPDNERTGIVLGNDGGAFKRTCTKLCTGGGKTTVMAMLIAWQVCNKAAYPQDTRFSKNIFIVAPGLTVKSRLQVLQTGGNNNYYEQFKIVPSALMDKFHQGRVRVDNWHSLMWETEEAITKNKHVDKRGVKSDEAYTREVLGDMANASNILVINDEAHHAWRKNPENKGKIADRDAEKEATIWIGGLDRIHKTSKILTCYDFSATPFAPSGKKNDEEALFSWIVSDFGLNDGIEAGLVKTPRVVVRDDAGVDPKTFKSKLYHIYSDETVKYDINRSVDETAPLPDLIAQAYYLLGKDWEETYKEWKAAGQTIPPVMITVANRTETAARIRHTFEAKCISIPELCEKDYILQIDSKEIEKENSQVAMLREKADTVGQKGKLGEQLRNIVSVGMLTEGWDAKTVTHIMGLRAFSSQLLCEQVVGRGLRRTSYDVDKNDMFAPEYVNIFGIPFSFLPAESSESYGGCSSPKTQIEALPERNEYEISWANVIRIDREINPKLSIDVSKIKPLSLDVSETRIHADLAPVIEGKTDLSKCTEIDLRKLADTLRMQQIVFNTTRDVYDMMQAKWQSDGTKYALFGQVINIVEQFLESDKIQVNFPPAQGMDETYKKILYLMNMKKIVEHLWNFIQVEQTEKITPILNPNRKVLSTADMPTWYTSKPCEITKHSQISHCVYDSSWEATESYKLELNPDVAAWAKNDHLGFEIGYVYNGVMRNYRPDFLIRLKNGTNLVLETKGRKTAQTEAKRKALEEWVEAVNAAGEYGVWCSDISYDPADIDIIIAKHIT